MVTGVVNPCTSRCDNMVLEDLTERLGARRDDTAGEGSTDVNEASSKLVTDQTPTTIKTKLERPRMMVIPPRRGEIFRTCIAIAPSFGGVRLYGRLVRRRRWSPEWLWRSMFIRMGRLVRGMSESKPSLASGCLYGRADWENVLLKRIRERLSALKDQRERAVGKPQSKNMPYTVETDRRGPIGN